MEISTRRLDELTLDPTNARKHSEANIAAIQASLSMFGQRRAAVIRDSGLVLAGNGMVEAAIRLGWDKIAVTVVPDDWTETEARAFALADNRTAELAEWDQDVLAQHLVELDLDGFDLTDIGFASKTRDPADPPEDFDEYGDDIDTDYRCPKCAYEWSGPAK